MVKAFAFFLSVLLTVPASADPLRTLSKRIHSGLHGRPLSLGVLNFTYDRGRLSTGSYLVSERMLTYLVQDGAVVVERRLLDSLLAEQHFAQIGITNIDTLKRAGKILGVDAVVVGTLSDRPGDSATDVVARVIEVDTARVLAAGAAVAEHEWPDAPRSPVLKRPRLAVPDVSLAESAAPIQTSNPMIRLDPNEPKRTIGEYPLMTPVPLFPPAAAQRLIQGGVTR